MLRCALMLPARRVLFLLLPGALVGAFCLESILASRIQSPVFDEPFHIAAGLSYLQTGEVRANPQHPPLLKELSGLSLRLAGFRLPDNAQVRRMLGDGGGEHVVGSALIAENGPDRAMFWARLPLILLSTLLAVLIYVWGRKLVGELAALAALFLFAFDPTVLAHSHFVTMDAGLAAFAVLFFFALWNYVQRPGRKRLVVCGIALGAMLAAKFSALFLLPVAFILLLAAVRMPPRPVPRASSRDPHAAPGYASAVYAFLALCLIAAVVIEAAYLSPSGLGLYFDGIRRVNADHNPDYLFFLAGEMGHRFTGYFALAYLLKEPIAGILLVGIGLVAVARSRTIPALGKLFLLLPPAALFFAHTVWADDLGIRYILPALPFLFLIGGTGAAWLIQHKAAWARPLVALLGVWIVAAAVGIFPDHLSYFNEAACFPANLAQIGRDGGSRCGPLWLDDSNVDWGQGLKQLKAWADRNAQGRTIRLAYFGTFAPEAYGLIHEKIAPGELLRDPAPGLYAVSTHLVAHMPALGDTLAPGAGDWLRRTAPAATVGHAFYIYDIGAPR